MQNVVIFGANLGVVSLIWTLRRRGISVLALGHDSSQIGAQLADEFQIINYRDWESVAKVLEGKEIDGFVPGAHDLYYRAYSAYLDNITADGLERLVAYEFLHNKMHFRKRLKAIAPCHCPAFICPEDFASLRPNDGIFPALFKPVHAGGGRGILFLQDFSAFEARHPQLNDGVIEQCVSGVDLSISCWLEEGHCVTSYVDREVTLGTQFRITGSISSNDLILEITQSNLMDELTDILNAMGIHDGFAHCQIRMTSLTNWHVIEITRRIPGDAYPIVPELFGYLDYSCRYLAEFIPDLIRCPRYRPSWQFATNRAVGRVCLFRGQRLLPLYFQTLDLPSHTPESPDAYRVCFFMSRKKISLDRLLEPTLQLAAEDLTS